MAGRRDRAHGWARESPGDHGPRRGGGGGHCEHGGRGLVDGRMGTAWGATCTVDVAANISLARNEHGACVGVTVVMRKSSGVDVAWTSREGVCEGVCELYGRGENQRLCVDSEDCSED